MQLDISGVELQLGDMAKHIAIGKAWIIHSEDTSGGSIELISILSPRKTIRHVAEYVEQSYVDRFASIEEKIAYKKKRSNWPYPAEILQPAYVVSCGFGPYYLAHHCHHIRVDGNWLIGEYRFVKAIDADLKPIEFTKGEVIINVT